MDLTAMLELLGEKPGADFAQTVLKQFSDMRVTKTDLSANGIHMMETFISSQKFGFEARLNAAGEIINVYLKGATYGRFEEFRFPLKGNLRFGSGREAVEEEFGPPDWSRSSVQIPILDTVGEAIRYDFPSYTLYFQFSVPDGRLQQVALDAVIR